MSAKNNDDDKRVLSLSEVISKIKKHKKGFVIINRSKVRYAVDPATIYKANLKENTRDDFIFMVLGISGIDVRSYPLDFKSSAVIIIGDHRFYSKNLVLLKRVMYQIGIIPEEDTIQSIIPHKEEPRNIEITKDLYDEMTELIEHTDARKKFKISDKSQIVSAAVREFLLNYYTKKRFTVKATKPDESPLDYTLIGNYVFCNLCSQYECEHVRMFFKDEKIISHLKKEGIYPSNYKIPPEIQPPHPPIPSESNLDSEEEY